MGGGGVASAEAAEGYVPERMLFAEGGGFCRELDWFLEKNPFAVQVCSLSKMGQWP